MNSHQKTIKTRRLRKTKQLINFIRKIFRELVYSHNACTRIVVLSDFKNCVQL